VKHCCGEEKITSQLIKGRVQLMLFGENILKT